MNKYIYCIMQFLKKIFVKIIDSLMGIKLTLKVLEHKILLLLLLFDDGVIICVALSCVGFSGMRIVFVKTIGKCN